MRKLVQAFVGWLTILDDFLQMSLLVEENSDLVLSVTSLFVLLDHRLAEAGKAKLLCRRTDGVCHGLEEDVISW